ncbi:hypothetical protein [Nostoc sp. C110]|uniref:hypothetical protein n=1 Tax=Nostoc sp. C110 TaxID=3349876 RepID=UPI00370DE220
MKNLKLWSVDLLHKSKTKNHTPPKLRFVTPAEERGGVGGGVLGTFARGLVIFGVSLGLMSCQNQPPKKDSANAVETTRPRCDSFNKGDDMREQLEAASLQIQVPLSRFKDPKQGISTVLLAGTQETVNAFWTQKDTKDNWSIANKQTVVRIQPGKLDAQLLHRLNPQVYPRTVLFIVLPQDYWDKDIYLQPVLEKQEARWGRVHPYILQITAREMVHPFRGLNELGDSGDKLPPHLNRILNQVEAGSLYIPNKLSSNVKLLQPTLVNPQICPKSGS